MNYVWPNKKTLVDEREEKKKQAKNLFYKENPWILYGC